MFQRIRALLQHLSRGATRVYSLFCRTGSITPGFDTRRGGQIFRRIRVLSQLSAGIFLLGFALDFLLLPWSEWPLPTMVRVASVVALLALATHIRTTYGGVGHAFWHLALFLVISLVAWVALALSADPLHEHWSVAVALSPLALLIALAVFPLCLTEGLVLQGVFILVAACLSFIPEAWDLYGSIIASEPIFLMALGVLLPLLSSAVLWIQHVQFQTFAHFYDAANRDPLTQLPNRGFMQSHLACERRKNDPRNFALLLIDIDHFKRINDEHGHAVGDLVLRHTARVLEQNVRKDDIIGRFGGEEFLFVAAHTDVAGAVQMAERLRLAVESSRIETLPAVRTTVSIGVAIRGDDESTDLALERADQALYCAKRLGRNQVNAAPAA